MNQNGRLRVGDAKRQLDGAPNRGRLADDAIFAVAFVQRAFQAQDFGRKMIAFQRGADLIADALDERDLVIFETLARFAPHQAEQAERMTPDAHRRHQRRAPAERGIKNDSQRQRQIRFQKFQGLALR